MIRAAILVALAGAASGCFEARYLAGQGTGQWRLLRARRRITDVIADPKTDPRIKTRLELAMEARKFAVEELGLHGEDNYTRFLPTGGKPIAWNITVAKKDSLRPISWTFPIVGRVPYLGFFDEKAARKLEAQMKARDLDTYVRPVAGYSTIGIT